MFARSLKYVAGLRKQEQALIPRDEVERALLRLCAPPPYTNKSGPRPCTSDESFQHIASLLKHLERHLGQREWSARPRTYTVLLNIGRIDLMPGFIALNLTDYSFPYSFEKLPEIIHDDLTRDRFMEAQRHVLTSATSLESGAEGIHAHTKNGDDLYLSIKHLGSGGYGVVDRAYSKLSFKQYARKRFVRPRNSADDQQLLAKFQREISSLKRLSHQHLVSIIGSYTDQKSVAYLMEPIGECNLYEYLCQPRSFINDRLPSLRSYFGCLANAVAYLHRQKIRHRDLKPQNILVKNHDVYITDFGTALDWSKRGRDTTNDPATPFTEHYMAPEVAKRTGSSRNSNSDVWSLGVVFLDMVTVLCGKTIREFRHFLETHGTRHPAVWNNNSVATNEWFAQLHRNNYGPNSDNEPMMWIKDMLQFSPSNRPSAAALTRQIRTAAALGLFIGHCCRRDDEFEEYPSPPSSNGSDTLANLDLSDLPVELDFGQKPFGSLVESSRQNSIERWLSGGSSHDNLIVDFSSEPLDVVQTESIDLPYEIVEDDQTVTTLRPDMQESSSQDAYAHNLKTLDMADGYDIVQEDSDDEDRPANGVDGYEIMEDDSDSDVTVRETISARRSTPGGYTQDRDAIICSDPVSTIIPAGFLNELEAQLDGLPEDQGDNLSPQFLMRNRKGSEKENGNNSLQVRQLQVHIRGLSEEFPAQESTSSEGSSPSNLLHEPPQQRSMKNRGDFSGDSSLQKIPEQRRSKNERDNAKKYLHEAPAQSSLNSTGDHTNVSTEEDSTARIRSRSEKDSARRTSQQRPTQAALKSEEDIARDSQQGFADREWSRSENKHAKKSSQESLAQATLNSTKDNVKVSLEQESTVRERSRKKKGPAKVHFRESSNEAHATENAIIDGNTPLNEANLAKLTEVSERRRQRLINMDKLLGEEPQISPSVYMQEVWEAASSAPTSVMSESTRKAIASFGSGLAWQDRSANILEKYVKLGKAAAVRELLRVGCNPGTPKKPRLRPLMLGVKAGSGRHNKCVVALLSAGADVNAREWSGRTALHYAIEHQNFQGYTNLIRDLLEAGADPNNKDKSGDFPILQILYGGYEPLEKHKRDALACLLQAAFPTDVNVVHTGTGNTPLHLAVRRKDPWAVSMLLTRGAQINTPNGSGSTPLMLAANTWTIKTSPGQTKVLEFLLDAGANVNEQNELGKTALHFAASNLCERAVSLLLNKGANPKIKDNEDRRAKYYAGHPSKKVEKAPEAHAAIVDMFADAEEQPWG